MGVLHLAVLTLLQWFMSFLALLDLLRLRTQQGLELARLMIYRIFLYLLPPPPLTLLAKRPTHVALAFLEPEDLCLQAVGRVVRSVVENSGDILRLTIYDPNGLCARFARKDPRRFLDLLFDDRYENEEGDGDGPLKEKVPGLDFSRFSVYLNGAKAQNGKPHPENGEVSDLHLDLFDKHDGKQMLVSCAKFLATNSVENISAGDISKYLAENWSLFEPDFILKFGHARSMHDFPLWQLRVAEVIQFPSHRLFGPPEFAQALTVFGKRDRRMGK